MKGERCNLPSDLEGAQSFGDGDCVVVGDAGYFKNADDPSSYLEVDLVS